MEKKIFIVLVKECRVRFSEFGIEHPRFSFRHNPEVMKKLKASGANFTVISDLKKIDSSEKNETKRR